MESLQGWEICGGRRWQKRSLTLPFVGPVNTDLKRSLMSLVVTVLN